MEATTYRSHLAVEQFEPMTTSYAIAVDGTFAPDECGTTYSDASEHITELVMARRATGLCYCYRHVQTRHDAGDCSGACYYCKHI